MNGEKISKAMRVVVVTCICAYLVRYTGKSALNMAPSVLYCAWFFAELWWERDERSCVLTAKRSDFGSRQFLIGVRDLDVVASCYFGALDKLDVHTAVVLAAGVASCVVGVTLRLCAIRQLAGHFTMTLYASSGERAIVETGLYAISRHPSYIGLFLIYGSFPLSTESWAVGACVLVATTAAVRYRVLLEERYLLRQYGDLYRRYQKRVPMLIRIGRG